jgi:hypothetical protein
MPEQCADADLPLMGKRTCHYLCPQILLMPYATSAHPYCRERSQEEIECCMDMLNIQMKIHVRCAYRVARLRREFRIVAAFHRPTPILDCEAGEGPSPDSIDHRLVNPATGIGTRGTGAGSRTSGLAAPLHWERDTSTRHRWSMDLAGMASSCCVPCLIPRQERNTTLVW